MKSPLKHQPKLLQDLSIPIVDALPKPDALTWSVKDVSQWLHSINLPLYIDAFANNFVTGRKLLLLCPKYLCQMNIQNYDHQMLILSEVRKLFKVEGETFSRSVSRTPREPETHFKLFNTQTGRHYDEMKRSTLFRQMQILQEPTPELNHFERLHQHLQRRPQGPQRLLGGGRFKSCA